jgi:rod shape-determining protein MreD
MRPRIRFLAIVIMMVVVAAVLQTTLLARVGLPGGNPDLLLLAVIAVGLATGPNYGAAVGFGAGMLADTLPPDLTTLGTSAMILAVVGYVAGSIDDPRGLAPAQLLALIAGLAISAATAQLLLAWLFADRGLDPSAAIVAILSSAAYTTALGMILIPTTVTGLRRIGGGAAGWRHSAYDRPQSAMRGGGPS